MAPDIFGKATFQNLSIVHNIDKASPLLMKACATAGNPPREFLIVKMNDIIITGVTHEGRRLGPSPTP